MHDVAEYLEQVMAIDGAQAAVLACTKDHTLLGSVGFLPLHEGLDAILDIYESERDVVDGFGFPPDLDDGVFLLETSIHVLKQVPDHCVIFWCIFKCSTNIAVIKRDLQLIVDRISHDPRWLA